MTAKELIEQVLKNPMVETITAVKLAKMLKVTIEDRDHLIKKGFAGYLKLQGEIVIDTMNDNLNRLADFSE